MKELSLKEIFFRACSFLLYKADMRSVPLKRTILAMDNGTIVRIAGNGKSPTARSGSVGLIPIFIHEKGENVLLLVITQGDPS